MSCEISFPKAIKMDSHMWRSFDKDISQMFERVEEFYNTAWNTAKVYIITKDCIGATYVGKNISCWNNYVKINLYNIEIEDAIEKILGPLHRLLKINWVLKPISADWYVTFSSTFAGVNIQVDVNYAKNCKIEKINTSKELVETYDYKLICPED